MGKLEITDKTKTHWYANYKGYEIELLKEDEGYYIIVQGDDGYLYDGYWGDNTNTFKEALDEALRGSELAQLHNKEKGQE